jgi:hypothetical protein
MFRKHVSEQCHCQVALQLNLGLGRFIVEVSRAHKGTHTHTHTHTHKVGLPSTSDQPVALPATWTTHNKHKKRITDVLNWNWTRDPRDRSATVIRLSPYGHRNRSDKHLNGWIFLKSDFGKTDYTAELHTSISVQFVFNPYMTLEA